MFEEMKPQEFMKYAVSHPWLDKLPEHNKRYFLEISRKYRDHPICVGCEQIALRDVGWTEERRAQCPNCNRTFKATMTLAEYMEERLYK